VSGRTSLKSRRDVSNNFERRILLKGGAGKDRKLTARLGGWKSCGPEEKVQTGAASSGRGGVLGKGKGSAVGKKIQQPSEGATDAEGNGRQKKSEGGGRQAWGGEDQHQKGEEHGCRKRGVSNIKGRCGLANKKRKS